MDRVEKHREILESYLDEFAALSADEKLGTVAEVIISADKRHYQVLEYGHTKERWVFMALLHFLVEEDGSVLLLANKTEEEPFDELIKKGISFNHLKVGWVPPVIQEKLQREAA